MKKILLLLPIIGICSSLFAQAPKVENVNAQQSEGTKDVQINFQCSAKAGESLLNFEVWFRENLSQTQWERALSISKADGTYLATNAEFDPDTGIETIYSHRLDGITEALLTQTLIWNAGTDAPDVSTAEAQVRVIAFYDKFDEYGTPTPSAQVSGWNGIDDGNGTAGYDDNGTAGYDDNGTAPEGLAVYNLSDTQTQFLTDGAVFAFGYYAIEIYTDEFGVEYKNLVPVVETLDGYERDLGKSPSTISSAQFPTVADIDNWITEQGLVSAGTLVESGGGV